MIKNLTDIKETRLNFFYLITLMMVFNSNVYGQEICNNGIDDDGDNYIDCYDSDCAGNTSCQEFFFGQLVPNCQSAPPVASSFDIELLWQHDNSLESGLTVPITGDVDNDGVSEVVCIRRDQVGTTPDELVILSGLDGTVEISFPVPHVQWRNIALVIADVNNDNLAEIFFLAGNNRAYAYNILGIQLWESGVLNFGNGHHGLAIADFNQDGLPELYGGRSIINASTGNVIAEGNMSAGAQTSNGFPLAYSVAADVLPDNFCADCSGLELVAGNMVYSVNVSSGSMNVESTSAFFGDGLTAIADLDLDGDLDAVVSEFGRHFYIWDIQTSTVLDDFTLPDHGGIDRTGIANVSDFDGDGRPEFAVISNFRLTVFEDLITSNNTITVKWEAVTTDNSGVTSTTVFDFEADGKAEVLYRDETNLRIYKGETGAIIYTSPTCNSPTNAEFPIVVDVNGDGHSEIVVSCQGSIRTYQSASTPWVVSRKVWNQFAYFNVNINDDLSVPQVQQSHQLEWPSSGSGNRPLNNFLSQSTIIDLNGNPTFEVPDAELTVVSADCISSTELEDLVQITLEICNIGENTLPTGTPISVYQGNPTNTGANLLETIVLSSNVNAGDCQTQSTILTVPSGPADLYAVVNDHGFNSVDLPYDLLVDFPVTSILECDFTNNIDNESFQGCFQDCSNFPCGKDNKKVLICHVPPGNPQNAHEICISPNALDAHLNNHDDYCGPCLESNKSANQGLIGHGVKLYPNPFNETLIIEVDERFAGDWEKLEINVYDIRGKAVKTINLDQTGKVVVDMSEIITGLYIYEIRNQAETIEIGKILKD